jgi:hypothetical protein
MGVTKKMLSFVGIAILLHILLVIQLPEAGVAAPAPALLSLPGSKT